MSVYRGVINVAIGARAGYVDIDPPQQNGFCSRLIGASLGIDAEGETANRHTGVILSVRGTPRTTFSLPADGIPADAIFAAMLNSMNGTSVTRGLNDLLKDGMLFGEGYVSQYPYVLDKVRLLVYGQDGNNAGADVDVGYELHFDDVRLTNDIQQELLAKIYT